MLQRITMENKIGEIVTLPPYDTEARVTLRNLMTRMTVQSQSHSLQKFLRKMGGKKLNTGTNIKMVRILSSAVCPICGGESME